MQGTEGGRGGRNELGVAPARKELARVSGVDRSYRWGTHWVQEVAQRRRVRGGSGFIMSSLALLGFEQILGASEASPHAASLLSLSSAPSVSFPCFIFLHSMITG